LTSSVLNPALSLLWWDQRQSRWTELHITDRLQTSSSSTRREQQQYLCPDWFTEFLLLLHSCSAADICS
jgi:hypothetical protein